jgi:hypothetical protein
VHALAITVVASLISAEPSLLAPGPDDFARVLERTRTLADEAEAIGLALARLHNRYAELNASGKVKQPCQNAEARSILARARVLGAAHRDAVQAARAQRGRLDRVVSAPTVVPALDAIALRAADEIRARITAQERRWYELRAWHHQLLEPALKPCSAKVALEVTQGLSPPVPCGKGDVCPDAVAIIGTGGGKICPGGQRADGSTVVVKQGLACYGVRDCACVPVPVLPAAVLGP